MSQGLSLPTYFPISTSLQPEFESLRDNTSGLGDLKETQANILKAANTYFELLFPDDPNIQWNAEESVNVEPIKQLLKAYENLAKAQEQTRHFNSTFNSAKQEIRHRMRTEPTLNMDNIDYYTQAGADKKSFGQILDEKLQDAPGIIVNENSPDYIFLKNATFVIDHPMDPLPDEEEDDEIQIGGGKIDLKCPISMNYFESPMISKQCGHTFDQPSILGTWRAVHSVEDCPVLGCTKRLKRADFVPDKLMALRVKSFKAQQNRLENSEEYEKLD